MADDFREKLVLLAQRSVSTAPRCLTEESTKMFLVIPFLTFLGYDPTDPHQVVPEHHADFSEKYKNRVDFAILHDDTPIIAIEAKVVGASIKDDRGQLRSYFNAVKTVKMGILTDGLTWEFYADSDEPNLMDEGAFLSIDLREAACGKIEDSQTDGLRDLQKTAFDPDNIGAEAKRKHIFNAILNQIRSLAEDPGDQFCKFLLQQAGVAYVRQKSIASYKDLVKQAFFEYVNRQILARLDLQGKDTQQAEVLMYLAPGARHVDDMGSACGYDVRCLFA